MKVDAFKKRAQIKRRCGAKKKSKRAVLESADASPDEKAAAQEALNELEREEADIREEEAQRLPDRIARCAQLAVARREDGES